MEKRIGEKYTVNPCKACAPLGAALAMKGVENSMCILHGSQGCATYIRRFFIGHFREPVDIASSSFDESSAVFGGKGNLIRGIGNIISNYDPEVIGIATSCLAETIGEDIGMYMNDLEALNQNIPDGHRPVSFIHTDTAAYRGTHVDGFMKMTAAIAALAEMTGDKKVGSVCAEKLDRLSLNIFPWMVSPADIRCLKRMVKEMSIDAVFLPDYSRTLDGGNWKEYEPIPSGGTPLYAIKSMGAADHSIQFGEFSARGSDPLAFSPALTVEHRTGVPATILPLPLGLKNTDRFINRLEEIAAECGCLIELSEDLRQERGRLLDAYADVHKYCMGKKAVVYGEADFAAAAAVFLCELGIEPSVVMTAEKLDKRAVGRISESITHYGFTDTKVMTDSDFSNLEEFLGSGASKTDFMLGNSKGYKTARSFDIPLIRAGFPIQDRFGGQRLVHLGYEGALRLTDEIANTIISRAQEQSPVGYMSM